MNRSSFNHNDPQINPKSSRKNAILFEHVCEGDRQILCYGVCAVLFQRRVWLPIPICCQYITAQDCLALHEYVSLCFGYMYDWFKHKTRSVNTGQLVGTA